MSYEPDNKGKRAPSLWTWLAAMCALFSAMSMGAVLGWTSPALPSMADHDSTPYLGNSTHDEHTKSWIGSSTTLGALAGGLLGGPIIGFVGMKMTLIGLGFPFVIGWACIIFTKTLSLIMVGRVLTGLAAGICCGAAPTYCNHISTPKLRGLLGTGFQIFVNIGIFYIDLFGIGMKWRWLCLPALIPPVLMSVGMLFMPESPVWLMNKHGRSAQVVDALRKLRSSDSDIEGELKEMQDRIESERETSTGFSLGQLKRPDVYKPMIIACALMFFQQFSGVNAVLFYAADIFQSAGSQMDPNISACIVTGTMVVAVMISGAILIDKLGRKILLLASGVGHVISLVMMGVYFYLDHRKCHSSSSTTVAMALSSTVSATISATLTSVASNVTELASTVGSEAEKCIGDYSWLPVLSLVLFVIMFSIGFGPIPWMITAEITPGYALGFISSIATGVNWLGAFIVTLEFKTIQEPDALNKHGAFWLFAGVCAASVVFTALFVPESKGKSQEDMSRQFLGQTNVSSVDNKHHANKA